MNIELIRRLEKEAHDKIWNADVNSEDFPNSFNVEFCKLIVEECIRIVNEFGDDVENGNIFGVPEYRKLSDAINSGHTGELLWVGADKIREEFGVK